MICFRMGDVMNDEQRDELLQGLARDMAEVKTTLADKADKADVNAVDGRLSEVLQELRE